MYISLIKLKNLGNFNTFKLFYIQKLRLTVNFLIQQKNGIKQGVFVVIFISLIFISNLQFLNQSSSLIEENRNFDNELEKLPNTSDLNLTSYISGSGVNQDVRIYVNNGSENFNDNQGFFEIPSSSFDVMFLTKGDFNFTFQSNFTTNYVLEDNDALHPLDFISFNYNDSQPASNVTLAPGTEKINGTRNNLIDDTNSSYICLNATTNGILNFTIKANFSGQTFTPPVGIVNFNRTSILGLILSLLFDLTLEANLTVRVQNYSQPTTWKSIINQLYINNSLGTQEISNTFINENLNFVDLSNVSYIQFIFERFDSQDFSGKFYNFELKSTYGFDLPISNNSYIALEFDLKGEKTTVNGFYAWIRTLDLAEAAITQLNITLYRSNATIARTYANLRQNNLAPDYNEMIDTQLISYTNDSLSYFKFNTANTRNLNLSNYFVVIKSTNPKEIFSLVTLPYFDYGDDGRTEHQLITTNDDGTKWQIATKQVGTYPSGQLDASSFTLNVTRGYMPSDFIVNNTNTLQIQNMTIENLAINPFSYNKSSYLTWGKGRWKHNFTTPIEDNPSNKFQVYLNWNNSITKSFKFNVSYDVNAFWVDNATASYRVAFDENHEWVLKYNLTKSDQKYNNWSLLEFWYFYPSFMSAHNLTNPNNEEFLWRLNGESKLVGLDQNKLIIPQNYATLDGFYSLNLTSFNFIHKMHSFINFNETLWESNGFMFGDNISVGVEIQDDTSTAPISGNMNVTLFYPNGTKVQNFELFSSSGTILGSILYYDFNNRTILNITNSITTFGEYHLGFLWFNGSAIGYKKLTIYIDAYDVKLNNFQYSSTLKKNILSGELKNKVFTNYTSLIGSVNETTGLSRPGFYPIDNQDINQLFSYELGGETLPVLIKSFKQSENILNPEEIVNFRALIQNTHSFISLDIKINAKLVSYANEDWIIAEKTSPNIMLNFLGHPDDTFEFNLNLTIPTLDNATKIWKGVNSPIRLGGAKTIITVFIENNDVGTYNPLDYSLISNVTNTIFEGHILGLRITEETTSRNILNVFERDESLYFPNNVSFLVNLFDRNFVSSYKQFSGEFTLQFNSKFSNITINPNNPVKGQVFNISSVLTTEFGIELVNKNVSCKYFDGSSWIFIASDLTESNGLVKFLVNTLEIVIEEDLLLQLSWDGDTINAISENITISIRHELNNFSISIKQDDLQIYRNRLTTLKITLNNIGVSDIKFFNIIIDVIDDLQYSIVEINNLELNSLSADTTTFIVIEIEITDIRKLEVNFSISAQNLLTGENITNSIQSFFILFDPPIFDLFFEFLMFIMIAIFAVVWISVILYSRRIKKRIEEPIEEPLKRPRRGKYVPVSELKKDAPDKSVSKLKEVERPKKTADLDSLLEQKGLSDKKQKPKK